MHLQLYITKLGFVIYNPRYFGISILKIQSGCLKRELVFYISQIGIFVLCHTIKQIVLSECVRAGFSNYDFLILGEQEISMVLSMFLSM